MVSFCSQFNRLDYEEILEIRKMQNMKFFWFSKLPKIRIGNFINSNYSNYSQKFANSNNSNFWSTDQSKNGLIAL